MPRPAQRRVAGGSQRDRETSRDNWQDFPADAMDPHGPPSASLAQELVEIVPP